MLSSSFKLPVLLAAGFSIFVPVGNHDTPAIRKYENNEFQQYAIVDYIDAKTDSGILPQVANFLNSKFSFVNIDFLEIGNSLLGSTYIETEGLPVTYHGNNEKILNRLIFLLQEDDDNSYNASDFLSEQFNLNSKSCIEIIKNAFRKDSFRYARDVVTAIRFSDINYFQSWFIALLNEGLDQPQLKNYIKNFYNLYKETFDKL